jgi:DNA replication and repair protein RecF
LKHYLQKLQTQSFKNLKQDVVNFNPKINCIYGENAQGKTNILEAIHYLLTKNSLNHQTDFHDLINSETDSFTIQVDGVIESYNVSNHYQLIESSEKCSFFINQLLVKKHEVPLTPFKMVPQDSFEFYQSRSTRLKWLDHYISTVSQAYQQTIKNYTKLLKSKNTLLKQQYNSHTKPQLIAINDILAKQVLEIVTLRKKYCTELNAQVEQTFNALFEQGSNLQVIYKCPFAQMGSTSEIAMYLNHLLEQEMIRHVAITGTHLSKFDIYLDKFPILSYGSMGQKKIAFFSLFFACIAIYLKGSEKDASPLVLIDDISSELDSRRWNSLIKYFEVNNLQVVLTTANKAFINMIKDTPSVQLFFIKCGSIENMEGEH